jgi:hypothetical protein
MGFEYSSQPPLTGLWGTLPGGKGHFVGALESRNFGGKKDFFKENLIRLSENNYNNDVMNTCNEWWCSTSGTEMVRTMSCMCKI